MERERARAREREREREREKASVRHYTATVPTYCAIKFQKEGEEGEGKRTKTLNPLESQHARTVNNEGAYLFKLYAYFFVREHVSIQKLGMLKRGGKTAGRTLTASDKGAAGAPGRDISTLGAAQSPTTVAATRIVAAASAGARGREAADAAKQETESFAKLYADVGTVE